MADGTRQATCNWIGSSYTYFIHSFDTEFKPAQGNYILCKFNSDRKWVPVYIGETGDLSSRFEKHHAADCIRRNGATHIHVHSSSSKQSRLDEETDLRSRFSTKCNKQ